MIDFHTHILPEIDDGSNSAKESVVLLKRLKGQGVNHVVLTPHFYAYSSSAENYKEIREKSLKMLLAELEADPVEISLYVGSEVYFFEELWRIDNLDNLCIKGTKYMLLEMPFGVWTDSMVSSVEKLIGKGIVPIIAHFERYLKYKGNKPKIYEMLNMGAVIQMNCEYLNKFTTRGKAIRLLKNGVVSLIGTDSHNLFDRPPMYAEAISFMKKKLPGEEYKRIIYTQKRILSEAEKVY